MTYTEKEFDQFLHGISLSLLSKKSAQHWRYDEETAKEIEWLEALERKVRADKADRKTENSSEKPNNCEPKICDTCRYYNSNIPCGSTPSACKEADKFAEEFVDGLKKLKPTISKMEQVEDEPMKTTDYCDICKRDMCEICIADATNPYCVPSHYEINYEPKDEPQRDCFLCNWLGEVDVCGRCRNRNLFAEADTEPKPKDEPQTDCAWREPK